MIKLTHKDIIKLLGREPKKPQTDLANVYYGSVVLVTGAGGSIGSELCLQLIALNPKVLILLDANEFSLYNIDYQLRQQKSQTKIVPLLASVLDENVLLNLFNTFKVDYVFHTAAYKHVPLVERNAFAGVVNNVIGTYVLSNVCSKYPIKKFVLVSTDKAVNPTNIMGASKKLAEDVVLSLDDRFSVVRFGNVLWSTGSVLPLFYSQLTTQNKVTVTHKEVTRYFMTIPEAVLLIKESPLLQGSIKILNMGAPIKIVDLAYSLADLLAIKDFSVEYIGLREGEKLHEELTLGLCMHPTDHPDISIANEPVKGRGFVESTIAFIKKHKETNNVTELRSFLKENVQGYAPLCGVVDDMWVESQYVKLTEEHDCFVPPYENAINCTK